MLKDNLHGHKAFPVLLNLRYFVLCGVEAAAPQPDRKRFMPSSQPLKKPLTIFFSAGEPSGDLHGANLIRQLQARCPDFEAVGYGGPKMAAAGCQLHADLTALAVMWFARVLVNLHKFWDLASRADRYFRHHRPDAVVLIDYPGFNWWIARRAKAHGIPVFYYTPPQIWAWAQWRVKKMRRLVDHVLCSLPFEEAWFREHGCNATFVGHPFFDEVRRQPLDEQFIERHRGQPGPLVTILPGSRTQEVTHNLRWFLKAAALVRQRCPSVRFAVAAFKPHQAEIARQRWSTASRAADRGLRGQDAGADAPGRLLHGRLRLGLAGTALPRQADGDPVLDQPAGLSSCRGSSAR